MSIYTNYLIISDHVYIHLIKSFYILIICNVDHEAPIIICFPFISEYLINFDDLPTKMILIGTAAQAIRFFLRAALSSRSIIY